jgi:hypothetical protein
MGEMRPAGTEENRQGGRRPERGGEAQALYAKQCGLRCHPMAAPSGEVTPGQSLPVLVSHHFWMFLDHLLRAISECLRVCIGTYGQLRAVLRGPLVQEPVLSDHSELVSPTREKADSGA